jgi:Cof subfamily protein (haloacid dehalogenase superfamily)
MRTEAPIRLIVADLDGTLLNSNHEVAPFTDKALRDALARGVRFTVATGKTFPSTQRWIDQYGIEIPVICGNGTIVHAPDGSVLHDEPLQLEYAIEGIRLAQQAGLTPVIYSGPGIITTEYNASVQVLVDHHEPAPLVVADLEATLNDEHHCDKIVFINEFDLPGVAAFQKVLESVFAGRAQVLRTGLISVVEMMPLGVTKGTAMSFILDYLNIPAANVMAFGDNCNDLDMIRRAGIGVAMGHAPEAVRHGADYVTRTNNEDGVGHAIQKFVLQSNTVGTL